MSRVVHIALVVASFGCGNVRQRSPEAALTASTVANGTIDLTLPASTEPQTDAEVFDETAVFAPNFAVNQNDPALADLFSKQGVSELCFPTSLSEALIYLFGYHNPGYANLQLPGLAADHRSIDPNALVRNLAAANVPSFYRARASAV